jgi:NTE family protein
MERKRTAFVLTGGGARGALQIGALRALFENGIQPDLIVGTSIGAWNGAALALDPTLAGIQRMEEVWRAATLNQVLLGREIASRRPLQAADQALIVAAGRRIAQGHASLYGDIGVSMLAERYFQDHTFADLRVPALIVAASLTTGARRVFSSGALASAVKASSAIPGIFPAVAIDDEVYVDGATIDNVNFDVALDAGAQRIFILDIGIVEHPRDETYLDGAPAQGRGSHRGRLPASPHPLAILMERAQQVGGVYRAQSALQHIPASIETHALRLTVSGFGTTYAFAKASEWMDAGYRAACEQLPALVTR